MMMNVMNQSYTASTVLFTSYSHSEIIGTSNQSRWRVWGKGMLGQLNRRRKQKERKDGRGIEGEAALIACKTTSGKTCIQSEVIAPTKSIKGALN